MDEIKRLIPECRHDELVVYIEEIHRKTKVPKEEIIACLKNNVMMYKLEYAVERTYFEILIQLVEDSF